MYRLAPLLMAAWTAACGGPPRHAHHARADDEVRAASPFGADERFVPKAFGVEVTGEGRPIIFIPGLACPGDVWAETVAHLGPATRRTSSRSPGSPDASRFDEPLSAAVRRDLTRYIRARKLVHPIVVGHSMGGFIAYWIASHHPELVGPVIIVDASPALSGGIDEARDLRTKWRSASDAQFEAQLRASFSSMTRVPRRMAPVLDEIVRSDRRSIGDAIYEMVTTDLTAHVKDIQAPVLVVAADGPLQRRIRDQTESIPDHQIIVVPNTRHFVMWDDPDAFYRVIDKFLAAHP